MTSLYLLESPLQSSYENKRKAINHHNAINNTLVKSGEAGLEDNRDGKFYEDSQMVLDTN